MLIDINHLLISNKYSQILKKTDKNIAFGSIDLGGLDLSPSDTCRTCNPRNPSVTNSESILSDSGSCNTCVSGNPILSMFNSLLNANTPGSRRKTYNTANADRINNVTDDEYTKKLFLLIWVDKTDEFIKELANCTDINASIPGYKSLLHEAACRGNKKAVEEILKFPNVDINARDNLGRTATDIAKSYGWNKISDMIKDYAPGVDRRERVKQKSEAIQQKAADTTVPMETIILMLSSSDTTMRQHALDNLIKYIDSDSFSPKFKDELGRDVIQLALISKDEKIKTVIAKAMQKGVDINSTNPSGQTCLIQAIKNLTIADKDEEKMTAMSVIKFILDQKPKIDLQDKNGMSAFHYACIASSEPLFELILSANPNVLLKDLKGRIGIELTKSEKLKAIYQKHLIK